MTAHAVTHIKSAKTPDRGRDGKSTVVVASKHIDALRYNVRHPPCKETTAPDGTHYFSSNPSLVYPRINHESSSHLVTQVGAPTLARRETCITSTTPKNPPHGSDPQLLQLRRRLSK